MRISIYPRAILKNSRDRKGAVVSLDATVKRIRTGDKGLAQNTHKLREYLSKGDIDTYKNEKPKILPAATFSGIFSTRDRKVLLADKFTEHTGLLTFDIDGVKRADMRALKIVLSLHPNVILVFDSPSYKGLKAFSRVEPIPTTENDLEHKYVWALYKEELDKKLSIYGYQCDSGNDPTRLCFFAHDPNVYYDPSKPTGTWDRTAYLDSLEKEIERPSPPKATTLHRDLEFDGEIDPTALDFIDPDSIHYDDWLRIIIACKTAGLTWHDADAWSRRGAKHQEGDIERRWDKLRTGDVNWGTVVHFAKQAGYHPPVRRRRQKPVRLKKKDDVSLVAEALEKSWKFLSEAFAKGKGLIGLRSDTGTGKDHHAILHFQQTATRGFYSVPTTEHAIETEGRMDRSELYSVFRWRGLHSHSGGGFPHEKPCVQPHLYEAYLLRGRNAYELVCQRCPKLNECTQYGFRSQVDKAKEAQVIVASHHDLLFNPIYRNMAKELLPNNREDTLIINEFDVFTRYLDITVDQSRLEYLSKTWYDHSLGTFAQLILKACLFEENPIAFIKTTVDNITRSERHDITLALTQYRVDDTILSREEAQDLEKQKVPKTVSEVLALPLLETEDWNLLGQLELFFEQYPDPESLTDAMGKEYTLIRNTPFADVHQEPCYLYVRDP